jgi:hypothetical protein
MEKTNTIYFVLEKIGGWFIEAEMKSLSMMRSVIDDVDPSPTCGFLLSRYYALQ